MRGPSVDQKTLYGGRSASGMTRRRPSLVVIEPDWTLAGPGVVQDPLAGAHGRVVEVGVLGLQLIELFARNLGVRVVLLGPLHVVHSVRRRRGRLTVDEFAARVSRSRNAALVSYSRWFSVTSRAGCSNMLPSS